MSRKFIGPTILLIVGLGVYFAYQGWHRLNHPELKRLLKPGSTPMPIPIPNPKPLPVPVVPVKPAPISKAPRAAIVIDDVAYNLEIMDHYAALNVPLTLAILPGEKRAREFSKHAHDLGFAVIIHLPLEPIDLANNNPGKAGLYLKMTPEQMKKQFDKDVVTVPDAVGLNNHMGSAFTENEPAMMNLLSWVKARRLFFLDSRTSQKTVGPHVAKKLGLPYLTNHTFLDNADDTEAIELQLDKVMALALRYKRTVAIGHYRRKHLQEALRAKLPEFRAKGIELVFLPELLKK